MSTKTLLQSLFQYKAWANQELHSALLPLDAQAHPAEHHNALRILNHIYVVDQIFAAHLQGMAHPYSANNTPETPSLAEWHAAVTVLDQWYVDHLATLTADQLAAPLAFGFTDGKRGRMTREEMLAHVATHGGYHRGAVGQIMAQQSLAPPKDIFTRYLHQAEPERRVPMALAVG